MRVEDLRDSVKGIRMNDKMHQEIIENVKVTVGETTKEAVSERSEKTTKETLGARARNTAGETSGKTKEESKRMDRYTAGWHKGAAAAAVLIVVSGIIAFPVRAFVNSLVQERLEAMPEEEVEAVYETAMSSKEEADSYSRAYTDSENARYQQLAEKYLSGTFPEKEILQVDSEEDVKQDELCFIVSRSTFYLPDRELTDEEILEIMDFSVKRDYALRQNYEKEYAEELTQKEEEEKQQIAENVQSGGITEQQAVEIATDKLYTFFENSGEGMEMNHYYSEDVHGATGEACYVVTWMHPVTHKCYYVELSAQDGRVMWAAQTNPDATDEPNLTIEEAKEKIGVLREYAEVFIEKKAEFAYENVYVYYLKSDDGVAYRDGVRFVFEASDGSACGVTYRWDGVPDYYAEVNFADYQDRDGKIRVLHSRGEKIERMQVFQKLSED